MKYARPQRQLTSDREHPLWSEVCASPLARPGHSLAATNDSEIGMESDDGFTVVINDKHEGKRKRPNTPEKNEANAVGLSQRPSAASIVRSAVRPKPKTLVGTGSGCTLKAAKELKKKRIFCISNIAPDTSKEMLKTWIESCGINVLSILMQKTNLKIHVLLCLH